jgi:hypothetical protein
MVQKEATPLVMNATRGGLSGALAAGLHELKVASVARAHARRVEKVSEVKRIALIMLTIVSEG